MIIGTEIPCKVGDIITGDYYETPVRVHSNVRICILAETTKEEWKAYRESMGLPFDFIIYKHSKFYRVSTD